MASRATWRRVPGDPRSPLGWLAREGPRWIDRLLKRALLATSLLALYTLLVGAGAAFFLALLAFYALLSAAFPDRREGPAFADPSPCTVSAGTLEIVRDGALLGEDRVIVTFSEGWMLVEGHRATFALRRQDVTDVRHGPLGETLWLEDGDEIRLNCRIVQEAGGEPPFSPRNHRGSKVNYRGFEGVVSRWYGYGESAEGEPTLPPDRPHPSSFAKSFLDLAVATVGSAVALATIPLLGPLWALGIVLLTPGPRLPEAIEAYVRLRRTGRRL